MKFEQLLQIYWSKGFLYGGKVESLNTNFDEFFYAKKGLAEKSKLTFYKRFEFNKYTFKENQKYFNSRFKYIKTHVRKIQNKHFI